MYMSVIRGQGNKYNVKLYAKRIDHIVCEIVFPMHNSMYIPCIKPIVKLYSHNAQYNAMMYCACLKYLCV